MTEKKQLELSARAIANLGAIKKHIASENPIAADRVINSVFLVIDHLLEHPMMGHAGRRANTRELVLPTYPYTVIYRVTATKVIIAAVLHQRQKH